MSCPCGQKEGGGCCGGGSGRGSGAPEIPPEKLESVLKEMTSRDPLMIFIKGTPNAPKCKFSRKLLHLLADNHISCFGSFDILTNDQIRQGLKEFSKWKTYPQIYINGSLLGGLDSLTEKISQGVGDFLPKQVFNLAGAAELKIQLCINQSGAILFMHGNRGAPSDENSAAAVKILTASKLSLIHISEPTRPY
eukprot:TRINITY_DN9061_c0_g1_i1.p1 TRINITY_DN9061_c0_g1~~TRINITY_DN9061_c0_g1_i1.p1  ORF type:complete len:193 (-),score=21.56 TRINITY_DN9061_c0_g1_i1:20-598(-)